MTFLLFFQALLECLHDLVPAAERFYPGHFLVAEIAFGNGAQPVFGHRRGFIAVGSDNAPENPRKDLVELVDQPFVLHEGRPGEIIEFIGIVRDDIGVERLEQDQVLLHGGGNARGAQRFDEF